MKRRSLCILLATMLCLLASCVTAMAAETVDSGTCGDNLTWTLDDEGVLTISGTGDMWDYESASTPWYGSKDDVVTLIIEDGVTSIGDYAVFYCFSLTSVTIPDSVTSIGNYAFGGTKKLTSVTIPDSVTSIGDGAFEKCGLTSVTIPDSVTSIGDYAFFWCSSLTSVTIGNGVTSIGDSAFLECDSLTSVTIGNSVTSIGDSAFFGCSLTSVTLPDSVTSIGDYAFYGCISLTSVTIPDSVTEIGTKAFYVCRSLTSVTVPASVTEIGEYALGYDSDDEKIENFVIYGYIGSAAETYAEENGFTFIAYQFEINSLSEVPDSLSDKYDSADALIEAMIALVTTDDSYTEENTVVYDVVLMISTDGGTTWQEATEDDFSENGITVTIPYPDGTDSSYDFVVAHMFTVTSDILGTVAGDVEYPDVTKTDDGIQVTLKGLSPVVVSWAASTTADASADTLENDETENNASENDETENDASEHNTSENDASDTGMNETARVNIWMTLIIMTVCSFAATALSRRKENV